LERTKLEGAVAKGTMKEDGQLTRQLESSHRRGVVALMAMGGVVPDPAEIVEYVQHVPRHRALATKAGQQFGLRLLDGSVDPGPGSQLLGEKLAKLAELHEGSYGVVREILLGPRGHHYERSVVSPEESEVG